MAKLVLDTKWRGGRWPLFLGLFFVLFLGGIFQGTPVFAKNKTVTEAPEGMVHIPSGTYTPFFSETSSKESERVSREPVEIDGFYMDKYPVTNAQFLNFVKKHPEWQSDKIKSLFTDENYLRHWKSATEVGDPEIMNSPVTYVSWFAAKAYCESQGKSLPTILQWEYVGSASEEERDGVTQESFKQRILQWYSEPSKDKTPAVGSVFENVYGVHDMHGLVWEWVFDFNSSLITGESRENASLDQKRFCGSGSKGAKDFEDYAAFMRFGFRSSLKGDYTVRNLGFRCVKD